MSEKIPNDDLSVFDAQESMGDLSLGNDNETIKQINRRSSTGTKLFFLAIILGTIGLAFFAFKRWTAQDTMMEVFEPIEEMQDEAQQVAALRDVLENAEFKEVKIRAIRNLGYFRDSASVPLLTEALNDGPQVRRAAAGALAKIGSPDADAAKSKLLEILPTTDETVDRNRVVWALAVLGAQDDTFIEMLLERFSAGGLQEIDGFDDRVITRTLGIARLSSEQLTNHEEESVRVLTAHALAEAANDQAVAPLARMLTNELEREDDKQSSEVIRATAAGLGRTGSSNAARPLFQMLERQPAMNSVVIDALSKSTAAPQLASLLNEANNDETRLDLVRLLVASHDPRVVDALAGLLNDANIEIKGMAAIALAKFGDNRAAPVLFELTQLEDNDELVSDALESLRYVADSEWTSRIAELLETHAYRKASVLRILGATKDPTAARHLERELQGDDVNAAARALAELDHEASYRRLLRNVVRPQNVDMTAFNAADRSLANEDTLAIRRAAILAMGYFGREDAIDELMQVVEDDLDDYELRGLASAAIGHLGDATVIGEVLTKIQDDTISEAGRRYYVQALWQRPHREISTQLLELIGNAEVDANIRRAAALAIGYTADPSNDERLIALMENESSRRHAALAIVLGGGEQSAIKLVEWLGQDRDLQEILQGYVTNNENDWFNLLTTEMFETGAIWRRLRTAQILKEGTEGTSYSYAWVKAISVLRSGWQEVGGIEPQKVREMLWEAVMSDNEQERKLAIAVFGDLPEWGLLLRARDEGGEPGELAREILNRGR